MMEEINQTIYNIPVTMKGLYKVYADCKEEAFDRIKDIIEANLFELKDITCKIFDDVHIEITEFNFDADNNSEFNKWNNYSVNRANIIDYCIKNNDGVFFADIPQDENWADSLTINEIGTTLDEVINSCDEESQVIRAVKEDTINYYLNYPHQEQIKFMLEHNIASDDFKRWQELQETLSNGNKEFEISYDTARIINNALEQDTCLKCLSKGNEQEGE